MTVESPIERETCGRCGGTGHYSYNQIEGSRCFGCRGKGTVLTKRGEVVAKWINEQLSMKASEVVAGQTIKIPLSFNRFVVKTAEEVVMCERVTPSGERVPVKGVCLISHSQNNVTMGVDDKVIRIGTIEDRDSLYTAAAEYRDSLTKAGKPRKARATK